MELFGEKKQKEKKKQMERIKPRRKARIPSIAKNITSNTNGIQFLYIVVGFLVICLGCLFLYQFLDPALSRSFRNKQDIKDINELISAIQTQLSALASQVSGLIIQIVNNTARILVIETFLQSVTENKIAVFSFVTEENTGQTLTPTFQKLRNDGSGSLSSNADYLYNTTTECVIGPGIEINDTILVKVEISGETSGLMTMKFKAILCDGSPMFGQNQHGELSFGDTVNQTVSEDVFVMWTDEIETAGGITFNVSTSIGTFDIRYVQYLVFRHRLLGPFPP